MVYVITVIFEYITVCFLVNEGFACHMSYKAMREITPELDVVSFMIFIFKMPQYLFFQIILIKILFIFLEFHFSICNICCSN